MLTRNAKKQRTDNRNNYVSVSNFRNIINGEPLIDYLELLNNKGIEIDFDTLEVKPKNVTKEHTKNKKNKDGKESAKKSK
jgi:hypothetical protein